jgi:hypothetical protein
MIVAEAVVYAVSHDVCQLKALKIKRNLNPGLQHKRRLVAEMFYERLLNVNKATFISKVPVT